MFDTFRSKVLTDCLCAWPEDVNSESSPHLWTMLQSLEHPIEIPWCKCSGNMFGPLILMSVFPILLESLRSIHCLTFFLIFLIRINFDSNYHLKLLLTSWFDWIPYFDPKFKVDTVSELSGRDSRSDLWCNEKGRCEEKTSGYRNGSIFVHEMAQWVLTCFSL